MFWFGLFGLGVYDFDFVFAMMRFLVLPAVGWWFGGGSWACGFVVIFCGGFV